MKTRIYLLLKLLCTSYIFDSRCDLTYYTDNTRVGGYRTEESFIIVSTKHSKILETAFCRSKRNLRSLSKTDLVDNHFFFFILGRDKDHERYNLMVDSGFAHVTKCVLNGSCLDMSRGDPLF